MFFGGGGYHLFVETGVLFLLPFYWIRKPSWLRIVISFIKFSSINEAQAGR